MLVSAASGPSSHTTLSARRPLSAAHVLVATTATPLETCTTSFTPLTCLAAPASKLFTLAPATSGGRSIEAISMPGTLTS